MDENKIRAVAKEIAKELKTERYLSQITRMLNAIYTLESREAAMTEQTDICKSLRDMRLPKASELIEEKIEETLTY